MNLIESYLASKSKITVFKQSHSKMVQKTWFEQICDQPQYFTEKALRAAFPDVKGSNKKVLVQNILKTHPDMGKLGFSDIVKIYELNPEKYKGEVSVQKPKKTPVKAKVSEEAELMDLLEEVCKNFSQKIQVSALASKLKEKATE